MKKNKCVAVLLWTAICLFHQTANANDSLRSFSLKEVFSVIKKFHPVARQTELEIESATAAILSARGGFDPQLNYRLGDKTFDNRQYYRYAEPKLVIPTWYGIEVSAGLEYLAGNNTDPQETLGRTSFAGLSVPLAKNLLMDKRRAVLAQSKIMKQQALNEQKIILNNLFYEAAASYWNWVKSWQILDIATASLQVSEKRFELVRRAWLQGDRPALDTAEALAQWQSFELMLNDARLEVQNAALELSVHLWTNNDQPYELPSTVRPPGNWKQQTPENLTQPVLAELLEAAARHPELREYAYKQEILEVERKLKFQDLLPSIHFKYQQLGKGYNLAKTAVTGPLFENNFQYGVSIALPLRFSEGRGAYKQTKIKIRETALQRSNKLVSIQNKTKMYFNEWLTLQKQVSLQQSALANYQALLRGEEIRFFNGEGSLFMVNARELKVWEARQKLADLQVKQMKALYALQWVAGLLG